MTSDHVAAFLLGFLTAACSIMALLWVIATSGA